MGNSAATTLLFPKILADLRLITRDELAERQEAGDALMDRGICPHCQGEPVSLAFFNNGPDWRTHTQGEVTCFTCWGVRPVSPEQVTLIRDARGRREARVTAGRSLSEKAQALGLTCSELTAIEMGRNDMPITLPQEQH